MAFTSVELNIVNQALARIGANQIASISDTTSNEYKQSYLVYSQTRDSLLRSYTWDFAITQQTLSLINTITLDTSPKPSFWSVGDVITGLDSQVTATILTVISGTEYTISYLSGTFESGERITNGATDEVYWEGQKVTWQGGLILWYDSTSSEDADPAVGFPITTPNIPPFRYFYEYQLPSDFLRLAENYKGQSRWSRWTIQSGVLLTTMDSAYLEYVKLVTDPNDFDPLFVEVLILALACKLISPLMGTQSPNFKMELKQEFKEAMTRARTVCSYEVNSQGKSLWNLARYSRGTITP